MSNDLAVSKPPGAAPTAAPKRAPDRRNLRLSQVLESYVVG